MVNELLHKYEGQELTEEVKNYLTSASPTDELRVIYQGAVMTMDFKPERINVHIEPQSNTIVDIHYG